MIFPLFCVFVNFLLNYHYCLSRSASWVIFFKFIFFCQFFLFLFSFLLFLFHFSQFGSHLLLFSCQRNFNFILFIKIFDCIRNFSKLSSFHKLTNPQSTISQHFLFQWLFPFFKQFVFKILQRLFVLFFIIQLYLSHFFTVFVHFINSTVRIVRVLRFFENA